MKIKEVIVVEGRHDVMTLSKVVDANFIITNGTSLNRETMELIKRMANETGVIVFTDPDYPGEKIRKQIQKEVTNCKHAFIERSKAKTSKKVGVEHASINDLKEALKNVVTFDDTAQSITWQEYCQFDFVGNKNNRQQLCNQLNISICNAKTLFNRLNMLKISREKLEEMMK